MKRKTWIKRLLFTLLALAGYACLLPLLRRWRERNASACRVLTYHSVGSARAHETNVSAAAFAAQMAFIATRAQPVDLQADAAGGASSANTRWRPRVAVTLDDGYADNLLTAAPILRRHKIPAVCFVTAGLVGTERRLPHDAALPAGAARLLTWPEVRALRAAGVAIGSHGLSHARLADVGDNDVRTEVHESRQLIERRIGAPVPLFSYPYGRAADLDARAVAAARAAGYTAAFTAMYGWNRAGDDPLRLRRIGVESADTLFTLRAKLNGALDLLVLAESRAGRALVRLANRLLGV